MGLGGRFLAEPGVGAQSAREESERLMEYVTSPDGTRIGYEVTGSGPPLVLVHGSLNDRNIWAMVRPAFDQRRTVYAMDRRGRGESGPAVDHALERQFEDVAVVIEAAGEPVDLLGHSFGAHCALGAAALAPEKIKHLVLYEPPTLDAQRLDVAEAFETGDPIAALEQFMLKGIGVPPEQLPLLKSLPFWSYALSFAATMPIEGRALVAHGFDPARYSQLKMPALFLVGSQTEEILGDVLRRLLPVMPQAEWVTLDGQGHGAVMTAPTLFAETVLEFLER